MQRLVSVCWHGFSISDGRFRQACRHTQCSRANTEISRYFVAGVDVGRGTRRSGGVVRHGQARFQTAWYAVDVDAREQPAIITCEPLRKRDAVGVDRVVAADPVAGRNRGFRLSCGAVSCIGVGDTGRHPAQERAA